jgi:hypothetical protein
MEFAARKSSAAQVIVPEELRWDGMTIMAYPLHVPE